MLIPNTQRVLVKPIKVRGAITRSGIIVGGQLANEEKLFLGEVIHPGDSRFKKGQKIYYSEYSSAHCVDWGDFYRNLPEVLDGKSKIPDKHEYLVVAEDDIMAYDDEDFNYDQDGPEMLKDLAPSKNSNKKAGSNAARLIGLKGKQTSKGAGIISTNTNDFK